MLQNKYVNEEKKSLGYFGSWVLCYWLAFTLLNSSLLLMILILKFMNLYQVSVLSCKHAPDEY